MQLMLLRCVRLFVWTAILGWVGSAAAVTPPVIRSTSYNGAYSNIIHYPVQSWMNTNTVLMTVEGWVYCNDVNGFQTFVSRHYTTNLWFGLNGNRLRFYRSGGTLADSDGTLTAGRWAHVAVTYDGATARFYINGNSAGTKALSSAGNNCTNSFSLGGQWDLVVSGDSLAAGYAFNGNLDEFRVWSVVRSQSAIAANMNSEVRSGTGLLATFGTGGGRNDINGSAGATSGIAIGDRWSGFGILPSYLCIPWTSAGLAVDGTIDMLNEYRGAETLVLRSTLSSNRVDRVAYLMVSTNSTNFHLYVGVPDVEQAGSPQIPSVQIMADVNATNGTSVALGDWQCSLAQDSFQGGQIYGVNPPFFPNPTWLAWGQSSLNWQAATASATEFHQSYEFRIHGRNLNYFTNNVGLLVRYFDYDAGGDQLVGPRTAVTNQPATYAPASWCGRADVDLSTISLTGSVTNVATGGVAGLTVALYSGESELGGLLLDTTTTDAQGKFVFAGVRAPNERKVVVTYSPPASVVLMDPAIDSTFSSMVPVRTNSPLSLTYSPCAASCAYARANFRYRSLGPVQITGLSTSQIPATVILRTSPLKVTATNTITVLGTNFPPNAHVYFRGSGCAAIPPSFCTGDFVEATIVNLGADGRSIVVNVPSSLDGVGAVSRSFQIVVENPSFPSTGGTQWNYGPNVLVIPPLWPQLYGWEFINRDDGPSIEEFEACYGDSIFNIFRIREPYYAIWAAVYFAWMDGTHGSCYGMAGTSRLMAEGTLPYGTFDVADGDGVHGVRFADGYLGTPLCDFAGELCPSKPGRWTGFDLFQPFRPKNIWARITSMAGAQTSAEALSFWLSQLHRPEPFGPRRGFASADPMAVLTRVRANPGGYTICMQKRDFGDGHCITPYGVLEGMALDDAAVTPIPSSAFSLIKIYDNNWPEEERYIEINRTDNTYRYNSGSSIGIYDGPGLFYVPMSVYRNPRHAPDPFFLASYGVDFLRILIVGSGSASVSDASGGRAGWAGTTFTNGYEGALPFVPFGQLRGGSNQFDGTMLFLPGSNAPVAGTFSSGGSNVLVYGGMGYGDIAFGFTSPTRGSSNAVDGILIGLNQGLLGLGLRVGSPVSGFGAMVSSRDEQGQSRVYLLDTGAGVSSPDVQIQRDGFKSLTVHNRGASSFDFRLNVAGTDRNLGTFERAYDLYHQPPNSTLTIRLPDNPATESIVRELDTDNDGKPETAEETPANGQLRIAKEAGLMALRWRQANSGEALEATKKLSPSEWVPVNAPITTEGPDRVARVQPGNIEGYFRLRATGTNCLSLATFPLGPRPNPWETNGFKFEAVTSTGVLYSQNSIASRSGFTGLDVQHTVRIYPTEDAEAIDIDVFEMSGLVNIEAIGALDSVVARQTLTGVTGSPQRITLRGFRGRIHYVRVISPNANCLIVNVCAQRPQLPPPPPSVSSCLSFSNVVTGQYASPAVVGDVTFAISPGSLIVGPVSGLSGNWLKTKGQLTMSWEQPCNSVRLRFWDFEGVLTATAYSPDGLVVATAGPPTGSGVPQDMILAAPAGSSIARVVLVSSSDKLFLQDVCCLRGADTK